MNKILFISIVFLTWSCSQEKSNDTDSNENELLENTLKLSDEQVQTAKISLAAPEVRSISSILRVSGIIDVPPQNMVSVSTPLGGYLKSTKLLPGMHVNKGEIIATMEDQQYIQLQQDFLTTKSKLEFAETEYNRQKELNMTKSSSDKVFQLAKMEYQNHKIELSALKEKLKIINLDAEKLSEENLSKSINIYSSIDGYVSSVNVNIGKYLNPTDVLFELVNPEDIHLNLKIYEKDVTKIKIGQKLIAYTNNQPENKYICEIILISKDVSDDRTIDVHCHFLDYDKALIPGMYMNAEIEVSAKQSLSIESDAIVSFEARNYVFIAEQQNQYTMVYIEVGNEENGFTEISDSTKFIDKSIVIQGAYTLLMSLKNKEEE